jgi:glutaredoxin
MELKRKVEIFTAGCGLCESTVQLVQSIACPSCEVEVLDMKNPEVAAKAADYGVKSVPSVVVNGQLAECCSSGGPSELTLRGAGLGTPL